VQALRARSIEQARQGLQDDRNAGRGARGVAIVQQQDVAGGELVAEAGRHLGSIAVAGVEAAPGPARQGEALVGQDRIEEGIAQPGGGAEEQRPLSGDAGQGVLPGLDFPGHAARAERGKVVIVVVAVVFHGVPAADDLAAEFGVALGLDANAKEGGASLVAVEQVQHLRGHFGVGTVVDGEGELPGLDRGRGQPPPVGPEGPAARPQADGGEHQVIGGQRGQQHGPQCRAPEQQDQRAEMQGET
jgi:hypothetical protein